MVKQEVSLQEITFGNEALKAKDSMELSHPMDNGVIRDWDDMELLWDYTFKKVLCLGSDNGEKVGKGLKILLTEPPLNPKANRAKMVKIMFERFGFDAVYVGVQAVMTLYAQGISTGVVVDSGDGVTHIVPVYDGYTMPHITKRLDIAGRDITRQLSKLLFARGYSLGTSSDFESIREIKEKHCYIATEREKEVKLGLETTFLMEEVTLEDGRIVKFGSERFDAPEILFSPHLMGRESGGLSELLFETIQKTDVDLRPELFKNIVLSGGSTMYPGFSTRLENDIKELHLTRVLGGDRSRQNVLYLQKKITFRNSRFVLLIHQRENIWCFWEVLF